MEKQEQFKKELSVLLKKFDAEIDLEECGVSYDLDYKIVVDFNWNLDKEESPTPQLELGSFFDGK